MTPIEENIKHLKDILKAFELDDTSEAMEFLDAIRDNAWEMNETITDQKRQIEEIENKEDEDYVDTANSDDVGLDTIHWELANGNLKIQMQMEKFIETLKKQNCVTIAY